MTHLFSSLLYKFQHIGLSIKLHNSVLLCKNVSFFKKKKEYVFGMTRQQPVIDSVTGDANTWRFYSQLSLPNPPAKGFYLFHRCQSSKRNRKQTPCHNPTLKKLPQLRIKMWKQYNLSNVGWQSGGFREEWHPGLPLSPPCLPMPSTPNLDCRCK